MRALTFDGSLRVVDLPDPEPSRGEALIAVRLAGICNTDLEITRGYRGFNGVLGHEFVGTVVWSPDDWWLRKRVVGEINVSCGRCDRCLRGMPTHCARRSVLGIQGHGGAFAELLTLPLRNLHTVPDGVPDDAAVFTEPLAAAFEIAEQVHMGPGTRVAVLGDGKLGLLCAQVVAGTDSDVVLIGRHEEKLALARRLGIRTASLDDLPHDVDVVVEATGSPSGMDVALEMVRPRGTVVMKSTTSSGAGVELTRAVVDEVTLVGSRCGPFARALRALEEGAVRVRELVAERYPLNGGVVAMERAASPGVLKVLLDIGEE